MAKKASQPARESKAKLKPTAASAPASKKVAPKNVTPKKAASQGEVAPKKTASQKAVSASPPGSNSKSGTKESPWTLTTPSGQSEFQAYRDATLDPPALVVTVGKTELRYHLRCLEDLQAMLRKHGDWMPLGSADEQKPAKEGTVEAWARSSANPVGGWYGLKKGLRGRFANYVPPVMKLLGLAEVEDKPKDNRMRAV